MAPHLTAEELASPLPKGIPSILINTREAPDEHAAIHLDNAAGVKGIMDDRAAIGRKRVVHIAGPREYVDAQQRADGFRVSVAADRWNGEVVQGDFENESGEAAIA